MACWYSLPYRFHFGIDILINPIGGRSYAQKCSRSVRFDASLKSGYRSERCQTWSLGPRSLGQPEISTDKFV